MLSLVAAMVLSQAHCEVVPGCIPGFGCSTWIECVSPWDPSGSCASGDFVSGIDGGDMTCSTPIQPTFSVTPSTPSRTLNSNFQPSATKVAFVTYSVSIACTASLAGGQTSTVELRSDSSATPSTVRATAANSNSVALAIALTVVNSQTVPLSFLVPIGHYVRLNSSGNCTATLVSQSEVTVD